MQYSYTFLAFAASVAAQSCSSTFSGSFEIAPVNITSSTKRDLVPRQAACDTNPIITLKNGILIDQQGRQGEIVANHQFQFDSPLQPDALHTSGFGVCPNNTLSTQGSAVFYGCKSGSFSNLYDQSLGGQCYPIYIEIIPCAGGSAASSAPAQTAATSAATSAAPVTSASVSSTPLPTAVASTSVSPYQPAMPSVSTPAPAPAPVVSSAPYPVANSTTPAGTGKPSGTGAGTSASSPLTAPASGAQTLAVGSFGAMAAAVIAFAML